VPGIARFLLVATFLEDSLRIVTQWGPQVVYLYQYRGIPKSLVHTFLISNVVCMLGCSTLAVTKRHTEWAVLGLFVVVVLQAIVYGFVFDISFLVREVSVIGALLMLLSDSLLSARRRASAGIPEIEDKDNTRYVQLAGRVLLIFLFFSFVFAGEMTWVRAVFSLISFVACVMVIVGFKAKWTAMFLILFLSVFNVIINNWWSIHHNDYYRDFKKYDFFQALSIMGGLLMLVNMGPGGISMDEKRKNY